MTTSGAPFLRVSKPQSPGLSNMLRWRGRRHYKNLELHMEYMDERVPEAAEEDRWEALLSRQARDEGRPIGQESRHTYAAGMREAAADLEGEEIHRNWRGSRFVTTSGLGHRRILKAKPVIAAIVEFVRG